jgi:hypothetical protein
MKVDKTKKKKKKKPTHYLRNRHGEKKRLRQSERKGARGFYYKLAEGVIGSSIPRSASARGFMAQLFSSLLELRQS